MDVETAATRAWRYFNAIFIKLSPVMDLFIRVTVSYCFLVSAILKLQNWPSTIYLFTFEYHVPLLSPAMAATLGTGIEFVMPIFIMLGLGGRLPAFILFIFNLVAVSSYSFLWTPAGSLLLQDHFYWGVLLGIILCHGYGYLSLDNLIRYVRSLHPES